MLKFEKKSIAKRLMCEQQEMESILHLYRIWRNFQSCSVLQCMFKFCPAVTSISINLCNCSHHLSSICTSVLYHAHSFPLPPLPIFKITVFFLSKHFNVHEEHLVSSTLKNKQMYINCNLMYKKKDFHTRKYYKTNISQCFTWLYIYSKAQRLLQVKHTSSL